MSRGPSALSWNGSFLAGKGMRVLEARERRCNSDLPVFGLKERTSLTLAGLLWVCVAWRGVVCGCERGDATHYVHTTIRNRPYPMEGSMSWTCS